MGYASDKGKNGYFRDYEIGNILYKIAFIPLFTYFGALIYMALIFYVSGINSPQVVNFTGNYFPIIMVVTIVATFALFIPGKIMMVRSIEYILAKTRYEITPEEYKNTVREIKTSVNNRKSGKK
jgi:hypothetical protein